MSESASKRAGKGKPHVIGAKAFAAITAVEGLRLGPASRRRLGELNASGLSPEQRRAEVLRHYAASGRKK